jgi:hypothetical protein
MGGMTEGRSAPLRPLGVAEILDGAVRLVQRNARGTLAISAPFAVLRAALGGALAYATLDSNSATTYSLFGSVLFALLCGTVLTGLLTPIFSGDLLGSRVSAQDALRRVGGRAWALVPLAVVATIAEGAGLLACVVGGIWLWGIWAVAAPALVGERTSLASALRRSARLVSGTFWRVWGIRALGWVLTSVLSLLITLPFQVLASYLVDYNPFDTGAAVDQAGLYVTIISIGAVLSATLLAPVSSGIDVLLYTDLRMRKEGMDIVLALPRVPEAPISGASAVSTW